jgi:exodeoxyribonuclease-3
VRIATWNVNSLTARMPRVVGWIEEHRPDILCMQETKQAPEAFESGTFADLGYESVHFGDGRWNGVAILSRIGLADPQLGFGTAEDEYGCRFVAATCGGVRVHSVYVPNGRTLESEHYQYKLAWLARLHAYLAEQCDPGTDVAVCGDFNVAPTDLDVWDPSAFVGATHTSKPERQALEDICEWGLDDVFRRFHPDGRIFSWWDYRAGDFHEGRGLRIDLVLLSRSLGSRASSAIVDRDARKGKKPSDHAPVVVDLDGTP